MYSFIRKSGNRDGCMLAVVKNERARSSNGGSRGFNNEESGITALMCQGEGRIPERSEDMPQKFLDSIIIYL